MHSVLLPQLHVVVVELLLAVPLVVEQHLVVVVVWHLVLPFVVALVAELHPVQVLHLQ